MLLMLFKSSLCLGSFNAVFALLIMQFFFSLPEHFKFVLVDGMVRKLSRLRMMNRTAYGTHIPFLEF